MNTPIADFIDNYIKSDTSRLHMPGHKGIGEIEQFDITEIKGADSLYEADGIINKSEQNATKIFETKRTYYSTEGSSQCIKTMLCLAVSEFKRHFNSRPVILAARNVHKAFVHAAALIDFDVEWIIPKSTNSLCSCIFTAKELEIRLDELNEKPCAVYITSPDYLGNTANIKELSKVCKKYNIPLLVDNAHGAYLKFTGQHPIKLGADMCCDSAHKTLPVLTGGAYLHIGNDLFDKNVKETLAVFGSTSPSYLIMRSLDLANRYLSESFKQDLDKITSKISKLLVYIKRKGIENISQEPLKLTLCAENIGYSGFELNEVFRQNKIETEYADEHFVVLMFSTKNSDKDFEKIKSAIDKLEKRTKLKKEVLRLPQPKQVLSIRESYFSPQEEVNFKDSNGRICGFTCVSCPPAVPIAISGELITDEHIKLFKKYNINKIRVLEKAFD